MLKTNTVKRISAFFLALMMILGTLPLNVFAEGLQGKTASPIVIDSNTINEEDPADEKDSTTGSKTHVISFNPNGGSGEMKLVEVADGKNYTLPKNKFKAPEGKKFKSWTFEEDEQKEGYILTVTRDLELKANWEDIKTNPIKKAINSILGTDTKPNDKDKLEVSEGNIGNPLLAAGDPEGTVSSKDGKTRITHFDIKWSDTDDKTKANDLDKEERTAKAELDWAISGERVYEPGMLEIKLNDTMRTLNKNKPFYILDKASLPAIKLNFKNGHPDYDADYGKYEFAYKENQDGTTSLINVVALNPANHGSFTITYTQNTDINNYEYDSGETGNLNSSILINLNSGEKVEKSTEDIYLKVVKTPNLSMDKEAKREVLWPNYINDDIAPENRDDYIYFVYGIAIYANSNFKFDVKIKDVMPEGQELIGYSSPVNDLDEKNLMQFISDSKPGDIKFIKSESSKEYSFLDKDVHFTGYRYRPDYRDIHHPVYKVYLIAKTPKSMVDDGKKYTWTNTAEVTVKTNETNARTLTEKASDSVSYQKMEFTAPPGVYDIKKYYVDKWPDKTETGSLNKLINDVPVELRNWHLTGTTMDITSSYDPSKGNVNDINAYGHTKYKSVLSDDYLYFEDNLTDPLSNQDIEVRKIDFKIEPKKYVLDNGNYTWESGSDAKFQTTFYGKRSHDGEWEEIGKTSSTEKTTIDNIPSGYIRIKAVTETSAHGFIADMNVYHKIKPSEKVKKYAKEKNNQGKQLILYNIGTLSAYNSEGKLIAIKGTSKNTPAVNKTLELDKKEYGAEMYHAFSNVGLKGSNEYAYLNKQHNSKTVNKIQKYFVQRWSVTAERVANGIKRSDFKGLNEGTFYDLLPKGSTYVKDSIRLRSTWFAHSDKNDFIQTINLKVKSVEVIHNFRDTGRDLLVVKYSGNLRNKGRDYERFVTNVDMQYDTIYTFESYKDYGPDLYNYVALEADIDESMGGQRDVVPEKTDWQEPAWGKDVRDAMNDINPKHDNPSFLYSSAKSTVDTDTLTVTGLSKNVKSDNDQKYVQDTSVKEGGSYSYKLRLASHKGTTTSDLILYDSIENYKLLKSDKDHGTKRWRGTLGSVDVTQPISKGVDAIVYYSTVKNLNIKDHKDLSDTSIWSKKKPKDLSEVTAVAVDLRKDKNGNPFKLKSEESVVAILNMKAPYNTNKDKIDKDALAVNEVYANTTVTTELNNKSEHKLIDTGYTTVKLLPISTNATIKSNKKLLDKDDKSINLKGNDFKFNLKNSEGKVLQTKTNDKDGNITFNPIEYRSWDLGEHTYTIEEIKGNNNKIDYDNHIETVKVNVEKAGDSELKATVVYDNDGSNFTNKEKKSASLQLVKLKEGKNEFGLEEVKDEAGNLTSYKVPEAQKDSVLDGAEYKLYKLNEGKEELVATLITKNGISQVIQDIMPGKYKLRETKAPKGYTLNDKDLIFDITDKDAGTIVAKFATDDSIIDMPSTGGQGTKALMIGGGVLLIAMAGVFALANKNKRELNK